MWTWNVLANYCEVEVTFDEEKTTNEVHCFAVSALPGIQDVDHSHVVTEGSDSFSCPLWPQIAAPSTIGVSSLTVLFGGLD